MGLVSRLQKVDLAFSYFLILIFISLFLELKVRVSDNITQLHIHYIRLCSDSDSDKSHDAWKDIEDSRRSNIIQYVYYILTSCLTHSTLR